MFNKFFEKYSEWSFVFLRLGRGIIFFVHGIGKLFSIGPLAVGINGTAGYFISLGIPAALFFAWIIALVETFGGLAILLGIFTRYAAALIAVEVIVAAVLVHLPNGFSVLNGGYEWPLILLMVAITLLFVGGGRKLSLEKLLKG